MYENSSSSFELFVVSFMQENVYIGHAALALTLGLHVFACVRLGLPRRVDCLAPLFVCHIKVEASR